MEDSLNKRVYKLYIATNLVNNYKYIGITSMSLKARAYAHRYEAFHGGRSRFKEAIRDYGIDSFKFEEILRNLTIQEAIEAEKEYILKYRTFIGFTDCLGYNSSLGGEGAHYINNEMNWIVQFNNHGDMLAIHKSLREAEGVTGINRVGIANACDGRAVSCGGFLWRRYRDLDSLSLDEEKVGRDRVIKEVTKFSLDGKNLGKYTSISEAAADNNCEGSTISKVCNGKLKSAGGFRWIYGSVDNDIEPLTTKRPLSREVYIMDNQGNIVEVYKSVREAASKNGVTVGYISGIISKHKLFRGMYIVASHFNHKRAVIKLDLAGNIVARYESASNAAKICGIDRSAIYNCCVGKAKTAGGYSWAYEES